MRPDKFVTGGHGAAQKQLRRGAHRRRHADAGARAVPLVALRRLVLAVFLAIWGGALWARSSRYFGWDSTLTQMGWFFTKAALLTFGGAYAVLPYVYQGAVEHYQLADAAQMIDGLALGETTPGPADHGGRVRRLRRRLDQAALGPGTLALAGCAGAAVATFFTFLPSFLFILLGGPLVEATHGDLKFTAPLTGITAAVVGVIVNLAVFFAWHVLWPSGWPGGFDWFSLAVGLAAIAALWRYRSGMIPVILACGAAGLAHHLVSGA